MHFQGQFDAKESQKFLINAYLNFVQLLLQILQKRLHTNIDLPLQQCASSRYISGKREPNVPANFILINHSKCSSQFCKDVCMQTMICLCNSVNFPGISYASESQTVLINAYLIILQLQLQNQNHFFCVIMCIFQKYFMQNKTKPSG